MHAQIDRVQLARVLQTTGRALPARPAMPVLASVLLEARHGTLTVSATDLELGIRTRAPAAPRILSCSRPSTRAMEVPMAANRVRERTADADPALDRALAQIRKQYGPGAIMRLGERPAAARAAAIPTGALALDLALGIGGVPRGRITEIYGTEGSGKTTIALHLAAGAQRQGGLAAYIDAEHALDCAYARAIGVDTDALYIAQPDHGEEALQVAETLIRSGRVAIIVIDSVAALVPKAELEGQVGDPFVGLQARLMSQALRKFAGLADRAGTAVVFLNQIRERVGAMFGPAETTSGGRALRFYASARLEVRRTETLKEGDRPIGQRVRVRVAKNKLAPPFREAELEILFGRGINTAASLLDAALASETLSRGGAWIAFGDRQLGQGRGAACRALADDPALAAEIERRVRSGGQAASQGRPDAATL